MSTASDPTATLVVGLGNPWRRDDGVGLAVAERLRAEDSPGLRVEAWSGSPLELIERWSAADEVFLIDALACDGPAGAIRRFEASDEPLPADACRASTHQFDPAEVVELARALGRLPARVVVYGVAGADFGPGSGLSPEVRAAVPRVVARIVDEAARRRTARESGPA